MVFNLENQPLYSYSKNAKGACKEACEEACEEAYEETCEEA